MYVLLLAQLFVIPLISVSQSMVCPKNTSINVFALSIVNENVCCSNDVNLKSLQLMQVIAVNSLIFNANKSTIFQQLGNFGLNTTNLSCYSECIKTNGSAINENGTLKWIECDCAVTGSQKFRCPATFMLKRFYKPLRSFCCPEKSSRIDDCYEPCSEWIKTVHHEHDVLCMCPAFGDGDESETVGTGSGSVNELTKFNVLITSFFVVVVFQVIN